MEKANTCEKTILVIPACDSTTKSTAKACIVGQTGVNLKESEKTVQCTVKEFTSEKTGENTKVHTFKIENTATESTPELMEKCTKGSEATANSTGLGLCITQTEAADKESGKMVKE